MAMVPAGGRAFCDTGYAVLKHVVPTASIDRAVSEILEVGSLLSGRTFDDLDVMYADFKANSPEHTGLLYDACKRMMSINSLAFSPELIAQLRLLGCRSPASIDVNFRIDSRKREKYLFGWHQDYWFSMGSRNGLVAWVPLTDVSEETGGLEVISSEASGRKLYDVRPGTVFNSYADAIELDEPIPDQAAVPIRVAAGDALVFRFDVLHRSLPVLSDTRNRWTLQARFADFSDAEFRQRGFRPASVSKGSVPYLDEIEAKRAAGARP